MVLKRIYGEEEGLELGEVTVQDSKRRQTFEDSVLRDATRGFSVQEFLSKVEPVVRKVVREEFERVILPIIHSLPRSSLNRIGASGSRVWQLQFINKLRHTLFTGNRIEAEDGEPVQIVVLDANTKKRITTGPTSLLKVEILVLDGDFGSDGSSDWSEEDFDNCVIRERDGRRPLVTGDLQITIKDGVGYLGAITFTDNSSWTRSRTFRLGARVVRSSTKDEGIREARSEAFMVKDHRGVLYKKHYPPSLSDEVWRLEKIGKDGAFHNRLASHQINKVQDLLRLLVTDPCNLRSILGSGMSNKTWETIVQHAKSCILDNKRYAYYNSGRQVGLMFDSIYNLVGATFDGQSYRPLGNLTASQVILVEGLKQQAYRNLNKLVEIDWPLFDDASLVLPPEGSSLAGSDTDTDLTEFSNICQGHQATQVGLNDPINGLPYMLEDYPCQLEEFSVMQGCSPVQFFSSIQRSSFKIKDTFAYYGDDLNQWDPGESSGSFMMGGLFTGDAAAQVQLPDWFSPWGQGSGILLASGDETGIEYLSTLPDIGFRMTGSTKPNTGWFKIRAAIKWVISVRMALAARRRARILHLDD